MRLGKRCAGDFFNITITIPFSIVIRLYFLESDENLRWQPASGPLLGTAGQEIWCGFSDTKNRRGGDPSGAAAFIIIRREIFFLWNHQLYRTVPVVNRYST